MPSKNIPTAKEDSAAFPQKVNMLRQRVLVALALLPFIIYIIFLGGYFFTILMSLALGITAWEFSKLFQNSNINPSGILIVLGSIIFAFARLMAGFEYDPLIISGLILFSMTLHLRKYEKGSEDAATEFSITLAGIFYIGFLGSYFIAVSELPNGAWWLMLILPAIWWADSGAYFIGSRYGKHKMTPRLSPNKSWEGYFGGILLSALGTPLLYLLYQQLGLNSDINILLSHSIVIGLLMGIFPTLGDLSESMIKRQAGVKDSGTILPGHGGMFDRIDSWLWGVVIGYYVIIWFFL